MKTRIAVTLAALAIVGTAWIAGAQDKKPADAKPAVQQPAAKAPADADLIAAQKPSYPLDACPISGKKLGPDAVDQIYEGRLVRFCCTNCPEAFKKDPKAALAKIDAAVVAAQKPTYPLKTCPVSGEEIGKDASMVPVDYVYGTRLVRFCCNGCVKTFNKNPAETMAKIDAALIAEQLKTYPLKHCIVMDEEVLDAPDASPVDVLYGTRLVRFCCKKCVKKFKDNPDKYIAKLDAAAPKAN